MATEKDGGPAFPRDTTSGGSNGMSLRDWFAGQALAALDLHNSWSDNPLYWEGVAKSAYVAADAMLAERERQS